MTTHTDEVINALNDLIILDYDAIEAYEAAIHRLDNASCRQMLKGFCADHERHTENLAVHVIELGGKPADGPDVKRLLTKGKVVIAGLVGDQAILVAMLANEEVTNKKYEDVILRDDHLGPAIRATVASNLADERRHRGWIAAQLKH